MSNNNYDVALVDILQYIEGLGKTVEMYVKEGFEPYMVSFMFQLPSLYLHDSRQLIRSEIERVYHRFLTEVVRNPWSEKNDGNRPILIACPDWPVFKRTNKLTRLLPWEGVHAGGILLIPVRYRLKNGVKDHFETVKKSAYVRKGFPLSRIHVEHITHDIAYVVDYSFKALKRRLCTVDDVIFLPSSRSERPSRRSKLERTDSSTGPAWDCWGSGYRCFHKRRR